MSRTIFVVLAHFVLEQICNTLYSRSTAFYKNKERGIELKVMVQKKDGSFVDWDNNCLIQAVQKATSSNSFTR